jgi:two-component system, chemotaxis family, chemotaxis protein CheY
MTARPSRILSVEDSDDDFDTIVLAARRACPNATVLRAADGDEALARLRSEDVSTLDLVLLDNNLPGAMSGLDVLTELRSNPQTRHLRTVMFTTSNNPRECLACHRAGANAYHVKSVRFDECVRTLETLFQYWVGSAVKPVARGAVR